MNPTRVVEARATSSKPTLSCFSCTISAASDCPPGEAGEAGTASKVGTGARTPKNQVPNTTFDCPFKRREKCATFSQRLSERHNKPRIPEAKGFQRNTAGACPDRKQNPGARPFPRKRETHRQSNEPRVDIDFRFRGNDDDGGGGWRMDEGGRCQRFCSCFVFFCSAAAPGKSVEPKAVGSI